MSRMPSASSSSSHSLSHSSQSSFITSRRAAASDDDSKGGEEPLPASGSFFYEVPSTTSENDDVVEIFASSMSSSSSSSSSSSIIGGGNDTDIDENGMEMFKRIIQSTRVSSSSSTGMGFAKTTSTTDHATRSIIQTTRNETFVGIGRPLNDVRNPEYDERGYTLYADETTGKKSRVFEALVSYPSVFEMKIVGRDEVDETRFATEMVGIVARSCGVDPDDVKHTERKNGKWTSVTVHAPVRDADMLYALYECVDKDPRVKFKF